MMIYRILLILSCLWLWGCTPQGVKLANPQPIKKITPSTLGLPQLRLNTPMHTAPITRSSIDKQQRYLVTASHDKTARVWSLETGALLQVLRVPISAGNEGKLYSVAISPDGETVAVGGWTGNKCKNLNCEIYLFKRSTGTLIKRLTGLENVIHHLSFSANGKQLMATLGGANGIRVYETTHYQLIFADRDYGNDSYWANFAENGRLVTSSYDGYLRLYSKDFKLLKKEKLVGGKEPFAVAFSPQGDKIAVGFNDTTAVNVLLATDLSLLFSPDTNGINNGSLSKVAWSADGKKLFAGGRYQDGTECPVIVWEQQGKGQRQSWRVGVKQTLMTLHPLKADGLLIAAQDPLWTTVNAAGKPIMNAKGKPLQATAEIADFRGIFLGQFTLSKNAGQLTFGSKYKGKDTLSFYLKKQRLSSVLSNLKLTAPLTPMPVT